MSLASVSDFEPRPAPIVRRRPVADDPVIDLVAEAMGLATLTISARAKMVQAQDAALTAGLPFFEPSIAHAGKDSKVSEPELRLSVLVAMRAVIEGREDEGALKSLKKLRAAISKARPKAKKAKTARAARAARAFLKEKARWERADRRFGISDAVEASSQADTDFEKAVTAVARRKPRSLEGALAMLSLARWLIDDEHRKGPPMLRVVTSYMAASGSLPAALDVKHPSPVYS